MQAMSGVVLSWSNFSWIPEVEFSNDPLEEVCPAAAFSLDTSSIWFLELGLFCEDASSYPVERRN